MQIRKILKVSIRGVPLLPIALMSIITVAAVLLATTSISTSITIVSSAGTMRLYADPLGLNPTSHTCANSAAPWMGTTVSSLAFPTVFSGVVNIMQSNTTKGTAAVAPPGYFNTNLGFFCFDNQDGANAFITASSFTLTGTFPTGSTVDVWTATVASGFTGTNIHVSAGGYCIPVGSQRLFATDCSTLASNTPAMIVLSIPSTAPAGTYSFSVTVNFYSTASG